MPPPRSTERLVLTAIATAGLIALACLAWRILGGLGVGLLGLLVAFIAIRMELEGGRPVGPQMTPGLHAEQYRNEANARHDERSRRRADRYALTSGTRLAATLGGLLALGGFGLLLIS
ncbi:MAG: hypothetical protein DI527_23155 [Chelatococcus sp.]|nr:MAG: hypothetical protein DI527_23155 [Chelatococcus sp.]